MLRAAPIALLLATAAPSKCGGTTGTTPDPLFPVQVDGRFGYIDSAGAMVIAPRFDEAHAFAEGFASVREGDAWGLIDSGGRWIVKPRFQAMSGLFEGLVAVRDQGLVGFMNSKGQIVIEPGWEGAENFVEGLSLVKQQRAGSDAYGFIDTAGEVAISIALPWAASFSEGLAPASVQGLAAGFMRPDGTMAIPETFDKVGTFSEGLAAVAGSDGTFYYVDPKGSVVIDGNFEAAADFSEGVAVVKVGGLYGLIDRTGAQVVEPSWSQAGNAASGRVAIKVGGVIGFVDTAGTPVIPPQFEDSHGFTGPLAAVQRQWRWAYIDRSGKTVWSQPPPLPAADAAFSALVGQAVSKAYYPFMVDGSLVLGDYVTSSPSETEAIAIARVHPEWEVVIPLEVDEQWHWGVFEADRDYMLRELTQTTAEAFPWFTIVEVDTTAEQQLRNAMGAVGAADRADASVAAYLNANEADWQAPNNVPQVRRYGTPPPGLPRWKNTRKVHEPDVLAD